MYYSNTKRNYFVKRREIRNKENEIKANAEKTFLYEYNFRSSIAKALHLHLRKELNFKPEITNKTWETLTLNEKVELGKVEHIRWIA